VIIGFHHPGIVVPNLQLAREFYEQALDFEYLRDYGWDESQSEVAEQVLGVAGTTTRCALMRAGNCFLELFEYLTPQSEGNPARRRPCDYGIAHLAFQVSDIDAAFERFVAAGGSAHHPPVQVGEARSIYLRDPFGNIIELMQLGADEPDFDLETCNMLPAADGTGISTEQKKVKLMQDKVVIITGAGRERGMGQAAVMKFAEHGARVVVTDLARDSEEQAAIEGVAEDARALGAQALALPLDITNRAQVATVVERVVENFGRIDVLINNAGTAIGAGPYLEQSDTQWDVSYQVHLKGTHYMCQAVIPQMQAQGGGAIVNNASMLGVAAEPFSAAYTATKFGVVGLTKVIAAEFGGDNIRCNCVCPGSVDTQMQSEGIEKIAAWAGISVEEAWRDAERCALGRSAQPEEVANAMLYLASDLASYVSGEALMVTGAANPGV
jgi:3-oxoacyl-[acyl-carrier protein] reductase